MSPSGNSRKQPRFRLPGSWFGIRFSTDAELSESLDRFTAAVVPAGDEGAQARGLIRRQLTTAVDRGREQGIRAMFVCTELAPGVPLPATLTVLEPSDLSIAPAIGTSPEAVITTFRRALADAGTGGIDDAVIVEGEGFAALRIVRQESSTWTPTAFSEEPAGPDVRERFPAMFSAEAEAEARQSHLAQLRVDYWCTVPGSKRIMVASFVTPLGDIPHTMLGFFDAIIGAAYFDDPAKNEEEISVPA